MKKNAIFTLMASLLISSATSAATIDGNISLGADEYTWNTDGAEGNSKWGNYGSNLTEIEDASGGNEYDISHLGFDLDTQNNKFQFGIMGGKIISGNETGSHNGHDLLLGDLAISVNDFSNATTDSSAYNFAVRLVSTDDNTGTAEFELLSGGNWVGANIYNNNYAPNHITETYRMENATSLATFSGVWNKTGYGSNNTNVLEAEFDLSLLGYDSNGSHGISTYLTMTCVNDEALVTAVPEPSVYALMLGGLGLIGFMARRNKKA